MTAFKLNHSSIIAPAFYVNSFIIMLSVIIGFSAGFRPHSAVALPAINCEDHDLKASSSSDWGASLSLCLERPNSEIILTDKTTTYNISSPIILKTGSLLSCAKGVSFSLSADLQYAVITQGPNASIKDCIFELNGRAGVLVQHDNFTWIGGGSNGALTVQVSGSRGLFKNLRITNGLGPGIYLRNALKTTINDSFFENNKGLGIYVTQKSFDFRLERNVAKNNGLELIGIDYSSGSGSIVGNIVDGTGDNCISISGDKNLILNNKVKGCALSGFGVFGSNNILDGNIAMSNGQAHNSDSKYYDGQNTRSDAGIVVAAEFGGLAQGNKIQNNTVGDNQDKQTQAYGLAVYGRIYQQWTKNHSVKSGDYVYWDGNLYLYTKSGISGSQPPNILATHDGSAVIAHIRVLTSDAIEPSDNVFDKNIVNGSRINDLYDGTREHANKFIGTDHINTR